ncbi:MAG: hypothetical protein ACR2NR_06035 [Solirubrobacteraceae bacterium]
MTDFFEPPPLPPEDPEPLQQPPWFGPPAGTLPGVVALELVLAQTETVAVYIARLQGYPTGFGFDLMTVAAPGQTDELDMDAALFGQRHRRGRSETLEAIDPERLRLGVQFSDGAKATNVGGFHHRQDPPTGPVLHSGGGGGGGGDWHQDQWVWPLPPPGPLSFVCEWPAAGIPLTRSEIDAQNILDAAARAQAIFPDQPAAGPSASLSHISTQPLRPKPPADTE